MNYYMMNKNKPVAAFKTEPPNVFSDNLSLEILETFDQLPIGFQDINTWLHKRKASSHNKYMRQLMHQIGCGDNKIFIKTTHAASINDTFWIRSEQEDISWEKISLYKATFSVIGSKAFFEGESDSFPLRPSPELTCPGSFRKCFRREDQMGQYGSDIYIYKRGGEFGSGYEPYCEILSSEIADIISPDNAVKYKLSGIYKHTASKCNLFTDENYGFAPFSAVNKVLNNNVQKIFNYFESIGSEQQFREMLVIDALCFNRDRHSNNYGVLFNNDTLDILGMAPIFDLNISFMSNVSTEDLNDTINIVHSGFPRLGDDFTRLGQIAVNDVIKERVKDLKDFSFSFRGDDVFPPERVKRLEEIVQRQASAILSKDPLYMEHVFIPANITKDDTL